MALNRYYQTPFVVKREQGASGAWGVEGSSQVVGASKGWIQPGSGRPSMKDGKQVGTSTHLLFCGPDVDIRQLDIIEAEGTRYKVLFVADAAGLGDHLEVDLELSA